MVTAISQIRGRFLCWAFKSSEVSSYRITDVVARPVLIGSEQLLVCRQYEVNELYNFETWGRQLSAFIEEVVGEPAFLICNSVGGKSYSMVMMVGNAVCLSLFQEAWFGSVSLM